MRKVLSFSLFLMLGLIVSQMLPGTLGAGYAAFKKCSAPGNGIDQLGQQRAGAGEQDVDGFHGSFLYMYSRRSGRKKYFL